MIKAMFISFFVTMLFPISLFASDENIGFLKGSVWASNDNPTQGEVVTLYTVLFNGGEGVLKGKVQFFDGENLLGERDVVVESGRVKDVSISWTATPGSHTFSTRLLNGVVTNGTDEPYQVNLSSNESGEKYTISVKQKPIPITAQAGEDTGEGALHLEKIDSLQQNLDSVIPDSVSDSVSEYTKGIETFREEKAQSFIESRDAINKDLNMRALEDSKFKDLFKPKKDTTVEELLHPGKKVVNAVKTPWGYVKLFFLGVFIFIFKNPVVFYIVLVALVVLIIRKIIRKIRRS